MKIFLLIPILFLLVFASSTFAQTKTPTTTPKANSTPAISESEELDRIQRIKDIVASKVAELDLVEKRGILGTVKSANGTQITIVDTHDGQRFIDIDELTKFETEDEDESFGVSDIKSGDKIAVVGLYNKDTRRLLARFVSRATTLPEFIHGVVTDKDDDAFTIVVATPDGKKRTVDIEKSTKTFNYTPEDEEAMKSGFSDILVGERVLVVGFDDPEDKEVMNASRITHFTDMPLPEDLKKQLIAAANDSEVEATSTPTPKGKSTTTPTKKVTPTPRN